jgi:ketosteroid isomerase-like protein
MRNLLLTLLLLACLGAFSQERAEMEIRQLLSVQTKCWNRGDVEGFMQTYWKSDSLMFIGSKGVVRGWQQTLDNYKKGYPDTATMGKLSFDIIQIKPLSDEYAFVVGKWMLKRSIGDVGGHYTLFLRRINGEWKIVADHSS